MVLRLGGRRDPHLVAVEVDLAAESAQDLRHQRHVEDVRAVGDQVRALGQQGGRHQLEHAVLRATDRDLTDSLLPPVTRKRSLTAHSLVASSAVPTAGRRYRDAMAVHLTRIYTRTGDDGTTGLERLLPGLEERPATDRLRRLRRGQRRDRALRSRSANRAARSGRCCTRSRTTCSTRARTCPRRWSRIRSTRRCASPQAYIERLEGWCDEFNEPLAPLDSFILPAAPRRRRCCTSPGRWRGGRSGRPGRGRAEPRAHERPAGEVPQPALGPAVHPRPGRQPGRRRAVEARRGRRRVTGDH